MPHPDKPDVFIGSVLSIQPPELFPVLERTHGWIYVIIYPAYRTILYVGQTVNPASRVEGHADRFTGCDMLIVDGPFPRHSLKDIERTWIERLDEPGSTIVVAGIEYTMVMPELKNADSRTIQRRAARRIRLEQDRLATEVGLERA